MVRLDNVLKEDAPFDICSFQDAEWIVPFHVFKTLAEEYGLELVFVKNSHVFVNEYMKKPDFVELMRRLGALGDGKEDPTRATGPRPR